MEILKICLTAILSIIELFFLTKLMGKRQVSQLSLFDYINGITIASIAADMAFSCPPPFWPPWIPPWAARPPIWRSARLKNAGSLP